MTKQQIAAPIIETFQPDTFGIDTLAERIGVQNAAYVVANPAAAIVRHLRDVNGERVFVYSFRSKLGAEVWVLPAAAVSGHPDTGGEGYAWDAFQAKLNVRASQFTPAYHPERNRAPDNQEYLVAESALVQMWQMEQSDSDQVNPL